MLDNKLTQSFMNMGYQRLDSNAPGIFLFYQAREEGVLVVSVIHAYNGDELTTDQYLHILDQIKDNFRNTGVQKLKLLSLVITAFPDRAKQLCTGEREDTHWIVDLSSNRLIIYETQSSDFKDLEKELEHILWQEQMEKEQHMQDNPLSGNSNPEDTRNLNPRSARKLHFFSLINTIIIVLNIIAYIIFHHTGLFGGTDQMMKKGSLSWYYIINHGQLYRIFTSLFMHYDLDHLFSNMLVLAFIGDNLERAAGKLKYLFLYFGAGIIAGLTSISYNMWKGEMVFSIGASGAIFGVVGAMLYILIVNRGHLEDMTTRQLILFAILSLYGGISNAGIDEMAHIGGFIGGLLLAVILYRRPKRINPVQ